MKKNRFMQKPNHSYGEGGLTCRFNDYQLAEYIQQKRRKAGKLPKAVAKVGPLEEGSWVLGPDIYINSNGQAIQLSESRCCAAQFSVSLEILPPLEHLCLTHLTMYPTSELTCRLSDLLHPVLPCETAKSLMVYRLLPMFSYVMVLSVNPYDGLYRVIKRTDNYNRHQRL